jgi:D-tyrosyl-tRNA(Tyr) deacylase
MRALVQRVTDASVIVNGSVTGQIGKGLLVFLGIKHNDSTPLADKLVRKVTQLRVFADEEGKMNCSLLEISGELLVVSQFTLYGDTRKGNRPSYSDAAKPEMAERLYQYFIEACRATGAVVSTGVFQAHMDVRLVNDGPVTLLCSVES